MLTSKKECEELSDNEIIAKSLDDLDYFSCLYLRYEQRMLDYIVKISSFTKDEAQDILQEAFVKVWKKLNEYDDGIKFSSWLYRIVHNQTIDCWRKNMKHIRDTEDISHKSDIETSDGKLDEQKSDLESDLNKLLDVLPLKYKEILILKYYENLSYDEISDVLKLAPGTVAIRLNRAKKALKINAERELLRIRD